MSTEPFLIYKLKFMLKESERRIPYLVKGVLQDSVRIRMFLEL
jgi:hypothetical protein